MDQVGVHYREMVKVERTGVVEEPEKVEDQTMKSATET